jgi:hypothetical protein
MSKSYRIEHSEKAARGEPCAVVRCTDCGIGYTPTESWPVGHCPRCNPESKAESPMRVKFRLISLEVFELESTSETNEISQNEVEVDRDA